MTAAKRLAKRFKISVKQIPAMTLAAAWLVGCATVPPPPALVIWDAAELGRVEVVRQHLAAGTDANARGGITGLTALHQAAFNGHTEVAALLIVAGADVNATDRRGWTPLHSTVYWEQREVAALLLANGAELNAKLDNGQTPLDWAIQLGASEMAKLFRSWELDRRAITE
jgi:ankyrin repeat protein